MYLQCNGSDQVVIALFSVLLNFIHIVSLIMSLIFTSYYVFKLSDCCLFICSLSRDILCRITWVNVTLFVFDKGCVEHYYKYWKIFARSANSISFFPNASARFSMKNVWKAVGTSRKITHHQTWCKEIDEINETKGLQYSFFFLIQTCKW